MNKRTLAFLLTPCLSLFSINVLALTCSNEVGENIVSSNNYIFQILDFIDTPVKGIKQETRTINTSIDGKGVTATAKQTLQYDRNGLISQSKYDLYSGQNQRLYSEHLHKNTTGWENIIEDVEDKTTSIVQFTTDDQGRIMQSLQTKKALDFVFVETDTYHYDNNSCLINKNVQWQLKEINANGKFTGTNQNGASKYTFEYKEDQLAHVLYDFSNNMKNETAFLYQFDDNKRINTIQSSFLFARKDATQYTTKFFDFNDKNDWLSASKVKANQDNKHISITRELTYY
ncbi:hypothetical protein [Gilliamella sp. wkB112]|uniref:hypothetical protein n=1 Tax=Gilliamella sp. wkB112 TaxID=3120257 RepID=UPI00080E4053|nr:hypothetical protein [Gilliamella apicola]OCG04677.1 hypothetical protein A9G12_06615 [Gilliamella apicola]